MSLYDYRASHDITLRDYPFYALIMAAMRQADTRNADALSGSFPDIWQELRQRYNAPGGVLSTDPGGAL